MWSNTKEVKRTRKPHICEFCERMIDIGESALKTFCVDGGDPYNFYLCDWCAANNYAVTDGEEFVKGGLFEYVNGALGRQICESCEGDDVEVDIATRRGVVIIRCANDECANIWEVGLNALLRC